MTLEDAIKALGGLVVAALSAAVGWLWRMVQKNREDNVRQEEQIRDLSRQVEEDRRGRLTKEDVREVIYQALGARDAHNAERNNQWNEALTARIEKAVLTGVNECQAQTRDELERLVPRIVREVISQTGRFPTG